MKVALLIFGFFAFIAQGTLQSEVRQIELSKDGRGYAEHVRITPDSLFISIIDRKNENAGRSIGRPIETEDWTSLVNHVKNIKLNEIAAYPSPSLDRASDAALHSTLTIYTEDGKTYSHGYDGDRPHAALLPLHLAITKLGGTEPVKD